MNRTSQFLKWGNFITLIILTTLINPILFAQAPDIAWEFNYGGSGSDKCLGMTTAEDGGFVMIGSSNSTDGDITGNIGLDDYWIVKVNADGILEWEKNYGGTSDDVGINIIAVSGGYIATGYTKLSGRVTSV